MSQGQFKPIGSAIKRIQVEEVKYVSKEFQQYGYELAEELGDMAHKALYIKLAKETPRVILENARSFVKDSGARSKGRLFMWKLKELKNQKRSVK
jgi:hypothetical protein